MILDLHKYQREAVSFLLGRARAGLFLDPGLGKTAITLSAFVTLRRLGLVRRALVVAPLRVVYGVWPEEIKKWDQFRGIRWSIVHGSPKKRLKALEADADIYLINPDGIEWLSVYLDEFPERLADLDFLILDESTKFKNRNVRWRALKKMLPRFERRTILTGTPAPNSLMQLWTQVFALDQGDALGLNITAFRNRYFSRGGFQGREYFELPGADAKIREAIAPLVLRLDGADHLDLPEKVVNDVLVELPPAVKKAYKRFEEELFTELEELEISAFSAGSRYNLCRQFANGGIYQRDDDGNRVAEFVHDAKIDAIESIFEELSGKPLLVVYPFKHDLYRLRCRFGSDIPAIGGDVPPKQVAEIIRQWNSREIPLLAVQPQAMSHGLNLQAGGNDIAWLGLTDDLELYLQTNARIYRQGVSGQVRIHRILARATVDIAIRLSIDQKDRKLRSMLDALNAYRKTTD